MKKAGFLNSISFWRTFSLIFVLLTGVFIIQFIIPDFKNSLNYSQQIKTKKEQIKLSEDWKSSLIILENENKRLEKTYSEIIEKYPGNISISENLSTLNKKARNNNIKITSFKPGGRNSLEGYDITEIDITLEGNYLNLGNFIQDIESSFPSIRIRNVNILSKEPGKNDLLINMKIDLIELIIPEV